MSKTSEALAEAGGELVQVGEPDILLEVLRGERQLETVELSAQEMQERILAQLLEAEDIWAEAPTWSSKESVGKTFLVQSVSGVYPSKYTGEDGSQGVFVCFNAVDTDTGESGILTSSAARIVTRLAVAWKRGELPVAVTIVKRGETANGFDILDVEKAEL